MLIYLMGTHVLYLQLMRRDGLSTASRAGFKLKDVKLRLQHALLLPFLVLVTLKVGHVVEEVLLAHRV